MVGSAVANTFELREAMNITAMSDENSHLRLTTGVAGKSGASAPEVRSSPRCAASDAWASLFNAVAPPLS